MAGYFTNGMNTKTTAMTGSERLAGDTNLTSGLNPAAAAFAPAMVASGVLQVEVPLTGFTITCNDATTALVLNPAGTLATGTINLPQNPVEGQEIEISSTQTQTAVTIACAAAHTIVGAAVTALTAVTFVKYRFLATKWYRTR